MTVSGDLSTNIPICIVDDPRYREHLTGTRHPESPQRYDSIHNALTKANLLNSKTLLNPRAATEEDILRCHSAKYFNTVQSEIASLNSSSVKNLSTGDVVISAKSFDIALLAAGGVLAAVDAVMTGVSQRVFCNIRPPGHHACSNAGMGFCLFNNIAIGARYAQAKYHIKKILIVDWDVHHGNGTQEIFYKNPSIFYFSTHQSDIYPGTGKKTEIGDGPGTGTTLNVPIEPGERSRIEVIAAFEKKLTLAMNRFRPELVFISAGFDAHESDPLGSMNLKSEDFATLTKTVCQIANKFSKGRVISVLEGGYDLQAIAEAATAHVRALY